MNPDRYLIEPIYQTSCTTKSQPHLFRSIVKKYGSSFLFFKYKSSTWIIRKRNKTTRSIKKQTCPKKRIQGIKTFELSSLSRFLGIQSNQLSLTHPPTRKYTRKNPYKKASPSLLTVGIVSGCCCGVMGGRPRVRVVAPVIGGIANDSRDSCTPRGRLQRGSRGLVPPGRARLAAHVHPVRLFAASFVPRGVMRGGGRGRRSSSGVRCSSVPRSDVQATDGGGGGEGERSAEMGEREGLGTVAGTVPLCRKPGGPSGASPPRGDHR